MYGNHDIYSNPDIFGLETVVEVEKTEQSYSFDLFVIWYREEDGRFYWEHDSGCSCGSPFEDQSLTDSELRHPATVERFFDRMDSGNGAAALSAMMDEVAFGRWDTAEIDDRLINEIKHGVDRVLRKVRELEGE